MATRHGSHCAVLTLCVVFQAGCQSGPAFHPDLDEQTHDSQKSRKPPDDSSQSANASPRRSSAPALRKGMTQQEVLAVLGESRMYGTLSGFSLGVKGVWYKSRRFPDLVIRCGYEFGQSSAPPRLAHWEFCEPDLVDLSGFYEVDSTYIDNFRQTYFDQMFGEMKDADAEQEPDAESAKLNRQTEPAT
jgi:hypothetical protein